jgi:hypothetical protein
MTPIPPTGSTITIRSDDGDPVIVIPYGSSRLARFGAGLFLLCWLSIWTVGLVFVGARLVSGAARGQFEIFEAFWFSFAILAEVYAVYSLFRAFRPVIPETFRLRRGALLYDSGVPPLKMNTGDANYRDRWKAMFPKRTIVEIDRKGLQTLRLRETDAGNRLTVDANAARLDLAVGSSEIEREWLYQVIANRYTLESTQDTKS